MCSHISPLLPVLQLPLTRRTSSFPWWCCRPAHFLPGNLSLFRRHSLSSGAPLKLSCLQGPRLSSPSHPWALLGGTAGSVQQVSLWAGLMRKEGAAEQTHGSTCSAAVLQSESPPPFYTPSLVSTSYNLQKAPSGHHDVIGGPPAQAAPLPEPTHVQFRSWPAAVLFFG